MVFQLSKRLAFPDPHLGEEDGLLAVGGDLSVDRLLLAYSNGIFPWYAFRDEVIQWWCPMLRFVIFPDKIHVSHSMRTLIRKGQYKLSMNQAFPDVIRNCGKLREDMEGAWLGPQITEAYTELYKQGFAASVEVWDTSPNPSQGGGLPSGRLHTSLGGAGGGSDKLVGGLYGVVIGRCFFGESMFSLVPSASKLALIFLAQRMREVGGLMIDCQFETPHLKTMGGEYISYEKYMEIVNKTD